MFNLVGIELICTPAAVCVSYQNFRGSKQGFWYKDKTPHLLKYCNYGHASYQFKHIDLKVFAKQNWIEKESLKCSIKAKIML